MTTLKVPDALRSDIERMYREEERSGKVAKTLADIPFSYERISPEWWTAIMCKGHPGAAVVAHRAELPDDLDRGHMRVHLSYNEAGKAAGLPPSVFCKDSQKLGIRVFNAQTDTIRGETIFYNEIRQLIDLETPHALFAIYDTRSHNSIVVMNDLLLDGAEFCLETAPITRARIESQLAYLARLHGRFYGKLDAYPVLKSLRKFSENALRYDQMLNLDKLSHEGFLASERVVPPRLFKQHAQMWPLTLKAIRCLDARPLTFTHNDAHVRNWYVAGNGDMRLADWQGPARADWIWDMTFAISTSLTVENRRAWEMDLIRFYLDRLHHAGGPAPDFNAAWDAYRKYLFIALSWWDCDINFKGFDMDLQPLEAILEIVRRTSTAIDDLDAVHSFDNQ